jgi:transposase
MARERQVGADLLQRPRIEGLSALLLDATNRDGRGASAVTISGEGEFYGEATRSITYSCAHRAQAYATEGGIGLDRVGGSGKGRCSRRIQCNPAPGSRSRALGGTMIPTGVEIYVSLEPVDMRQSFDRLSGLAQERIGYDARSGALFLFFGRRRDALKVLFFDGSGMCIFYKRLDRGRFQLPSAAAGAAHVELDDASLEALLDGIDVEVSPEPASSRPKVH